MIKNRQILVLLIIIASAMVIIWYLRLARNNLPDLSIENLSRIRRIVLKSDSRSVELKRSGEKWILNGIMDARHEAVVALLKTLEKIDIKSPVPAQSFEKLKSDPDVEKVMVSVYGSWFRLKKYYVYKVSANTFGNVMVDKGKGKPYIYHIPGYSGNIGLFYITREAYWMPHVLFQYTLKNILSVELSNSRQPGKSFIISKTGKDGYILESMLKHDTVPDLDPEKAIRYFSYFHLIFFEKYADGLSVVESDSILSGIPEYVIKVTDSEKKQKTVRTFPIYLEDNGPDINPDITFAQIDDDELVIVKYFALDPVLKELDYFIKSQ